MTAAIAFLSWLYGTKYLKSSTFAVISRTKVYITLIFNSLFMGESVNVSLLVFSVVSFIGITLVVDETVFGLGLDDSEIPNNELGMKYMTEEAIGIMFCFVYVVANSISKGFETYYGTFCSLSRIFEQKPGLLLSGVVYYF